MELSAQTLGFLAHVIANTSWGVAAPIVKVALNTLSPATFIFMRLILSLLILAPFTFNRLRKQHFVKSDWPKILLFAILGITLNIGLYFWGLSYTSVIDTSVISATTSIFTALAAYLFLKEKISRLVAVGIALSFAGTVVIILQPILEQGLFHIQNLFGNILVLLATWAWVAYTILNKEISQKYDSMVLTYLSFSIGAVTFLPFAARDIFNPGFYQSLTPFLIFAILFETIFATVLTYSLFTWGLKYVSATAAGIISYLNPIVAILASIVFLGEKLTFSFIVGAVLVIIGLFVSEARHPKHPLHQWHNHSLDD